VYERHTATQVTLHGNTTVTHTHTHTHAHRHVTSQHIHVANSLHIPGSTHTAVRTRFMNRNCTDEGSFPTQACFMLQKYLQWRSQPFGAGANNHNGRPQHNLRTKNTIAY